MTRGRQANHALVVDPTGVVDPSERLAEIITRPVAADSALAVQARLHRDAGLEPPDPIAATRAALADLCRADAALNAAGSPTVVEPEPAPLIAPTAPPPSRSTGPSLGL
jgi:hypothetical protein